jgi:parallel beta-helix repeat protein
MRDSFIIGVQNGIAFARNSTGTVEGTVVSSCASRGIIIRNSNPELKGCTVTSNDYGLVISAGAEPNIHDNNIFQNVTADVQVSDYRTRTRIELANNWWGETALGLIEERILDGLDDPENHGFVNIEPILTEAFTPPGDGDR